VRNKERGFSPSLSVEGVRLRALDAQRVEITKDMRDRLLALKEKTEKDLAEGSRLELQRLREGVYGKRNNLILFSEAEEDLKFL